MVIMAFEDLKERILAFNKARDWDEFHHPKELVLAMIAEVGELAECYRWLSKEQLDLIHQDPEKKKKIEEEIADILIYLIMISYKSDIDMVKAVNEKLEKNEKKFPVNVVKGKSTNPISGYKSEIK